MTGKRKVFIVTLCVLVLLLAAWLEVLDDTLMRGVVTLAGLGIVGNAAEHVSANFKGAPRAS